MIRLFVGISVLFRNYNSHFGLMNLKLLNFEVGFKFNIPRFIEIKKMIFELKRKLYGDLFK